MKKVILLLLAFGCILTGVEAWAAVSGVGSVAAQVTTQFADIARFITALAYIAGMAFVVGALVKFKAHKDNPTQIPIGTPIALLFIGAALIFAPTIFKVAGVTMLTSGAKAGGVTGITSF
ncbi:MAG TPA: type IV secretion protein IcmD [Gammaproteobacteria bacterium]|nr:type IV secretion protein IcmD [Gammaproteobacteria bacterium]